MAIGKKASIKADVPLNSPLSQISAAQFVNALTARKAIDSLRYWPEKKKYELEVEPVIDKLTLGDLIAIIETIKGEKKKVEYEIPDWWRWRVNPDPTQAELSQRLAQVVEKLDALSDRIA